MSEHRSDDAVEVKFHAPLDYVATMTWDPETGETSAVLTGSNGERLVLPHAKVHSFVSMAQQIERNSNTLANSRRRETNSPDKFGLVRISGIHMHQFHLPDADLEAFGTPYLSWNENLKSWELRLKNLTDLGARQYIAWNDTERMQEIVDYMAHTDVVLAEAALSLPYEVERARRLWSRKRDSSRLREVFEDDGTSVNIALVKRTLEAADLKGYRGASRRDRYVVGAIPLPGASGVKIPALLFKFPDYGRLATMAARRDFSNAMLSIGYNLVGNLTALDGSLVTHEIWSPIEQARVAPNEYALTEMARTFSASNKWGQWI